MTRGVIATPHRLASEAGAEILRDGGNAVDAAIAADAVLCVVYPHMTSVGGDLMAIVWPAGASSPIGLIGAGRSGELATIDAIRSRGHKTMPERGVLSVTVPGTVDAWGRLIERYGTLGMAPVLAPAAALAGGYIITEHLSESLKEGAELLGREPAAHELYPPMEAGMLLRNPDLASVLNDIGRTGINGFYRGEIAAAIAEAIRKRDGLITERDLATHRSQWVTPLSVGYRDLTVYELPPPTQGLAALAMLVRLNQLSKEQLQPGPSFVAAFKGVRDACYPLRDRYITDPDFAAAPLDPFLDPLHAIVGGGGDGHDGGDTIYLCAADEHGNLVSLIQSVAYGFGSGIVAESTGMLLQNRGCYFKLDAEHVNRLEPKKRTMHTLIPAMAARDGRPWAIFGSMGGEGQPQLQTQVFINLVDHGLEPAEAVARPRVRVQADGEKISVEADYPGPADLARSGLNIELMPPRHHSLGHAHAIVIDGPASWRAGADPRSDGSVAEAR